MNKEINFFKTVCLLFFSILAVDQVDVCRTNMLRVKRFFSTKDVVLFLCKEKDAEESRYSFQVLHYFTMISRKSEILLKEASRFLIFVRSHISASHSECCLTQLFWVMIDTLSTNDFRVTLLPRSLLLGVPSSVRIYCAPSIPVFAAFRSG